jgi:hypothetical protein
MISPKFPTSLIGIVSGLGGKADRHNKICGVSQSNIGIMPMVECLRRLYTSAAKPLQLALARRRSRKRPGTIPAFDPIGI